MSEKEIIKSIPVRTITMPSIIPPAASQQHQLVDSPTTTTSIPVAIPPPPSCDLEAFPSPAEANEMDPSNPFFRKRKVRRNPAVLSRWIQEHHPSSYPTKMEKELLSRKAGMTIRQLNDFFANARRNIKKKGFEAWKKKHPSYSAFLSPDLPHQLPPSMEQQQHHFHLSQTAPPHPSNTLPVRRPSPIPSFPPIGPPTPGALFTATNNNLNVSNGIRGGYSTLPTVFGLTAPPTSLSGGDANSPSVIFPSGTAYYSSYFKPLPCSFSGCIGGTSGGGGRADSTPYSNPSVTSVSSSGMQPYYQQHTRQFIFPSHHGTGKMVQLATPSPSHYHPMPLPAPGPSHHQQHHTPYFSHHNYPLSPAPSQLSQLSTGSSPFSDNLSPLLKLEPPEIPPPDSPPDMSPPISPPALTINTTTPSQTATPQPPNTQLPWSHCDDTQPDHTSSSNGSISNALVNSPLNPNSNNNNSRVFRNFYQPVVISPSIVPSSFPEMNFVSSSWPPAMGGSGGLWEVPRFYSSGGVGGGGGEEREELKEAPGGEEGSEQVSSQDGGNLDITEDTEADFCDSTKE